MIQPTAIKNNIPFLISDNKVETLEKYLEANEPKLFVPQNYIDINQNSSGTLPAVSNRYGSQPQSSHMGYHTLSAVYNVD